MKKKRSLQVIADQLMELAIVIESAEESTAPIIDIVLVMMQLGEVQKELDLHRESYLLN